MDLFGNPAPLRAWIRVEILESFSLTLVRLPDSTGNPSQPLLLLKLALCPPPPGRYLFKRFPREALSAMSWMDEVA